VLVADEPTANLDSETAARVVDILLTFNQVGDTLVVATHDEALVARLGRRVLQLAAGRLSAA
jgi:cell division transport system ATP-binding protein